jgi:hypothetical protein
VKAERAYNRTGLASLVVRGGSVESVQCDQIRKGKHQSDTAQWDIWGLNPGTAARLTAFAPFAISTSNVHTFVCIRLSTPWGKPEIGATRTTDSQGIQIMKKRLGSWNDSRCARCAVWAGHRRPWSCQSPPNQRTQGCRDGQSTGALSGCLRLRAVHETGTVATISFEVWYRKQ